MGGLSALDAAGQPLQNLSNLYSGAAQNYLGQLGDSYSPSPGLAYATDAAVDANDRRMASRGMLNSGNTINMTGDIAGKLAYQDYQGWMDRMAAASGGAMTAAQGLAGLGTAKAGLYGNDANARVGLATNVTGGINNQATQAANAQTQGSANIWGLGMNLAKLGAGFV